MPNLHQCRGLAKLLTVGSAAAATWLATAAPAETASWSLVDAGADDAEELVAAESAPSPPPFTQGWRAWSLTAGGSRDSDFGNIHVLQLSVVTYILDGVAFRIGGNLSYADTLEARGGIGGGPEAGLRWHFYQQGRFTTFLECSAAAVYHENPLSRNSLRFNFDLQAGGGVMLQVDEATYLQGGWRWHHLSNGHIRGESRNFGYDGPMIYLGLTRSF
jgi:hypothetical protein